MYAGQLTLICTLANSRSYTQRNYVHCWELLRYQRDRGNGKKDSDGSANPRSASCKPLSVVVHSRFLRVFFAVTFEIDVGDGVALLSLLSAAKLDAASPGLMDERERFWNLSHRVFIVCRPSLFG